VTACRKPLPDEVAELIYRRAGAWVPCLIAGGAGVIALYALFRLQIGGPIPIQLLTPGIQVVGIPFRYLGLAVSWTSTPSLLLGLCVDWLVYSTVFFAAASLLAGGPKAD
jgi:hypothetical protein